ncbi:hypothetical protein LOZ53_002950 [Ophidiomyces ophidiicola]|nr:hypothetical protein LOZ53_002950 [Ophidiomyces ophidiicola]
MGDQVVSQNASEIAPLLQNARTKKPDMKKSSLEPGFATVQPNPHRDESRTALQEIETPTPVGQIIPKASHFIDVSTAQFWTIFAGILFSYIVAFFDSTLMASIHPVVTSHFRAANSASWLSTGFLLTCTAFQPVFGRLSDTFGRRPVYLFSIMMFFVTTAWCALAQSIESFIIARAFCGFGAGGVISLGMIMSSDLIYVEYRGIYQSYLNLAFGTGSSLGLAFGGLLADIFGWRATFAIQLPLIFTYLIVAYFTTPAFLGPQFAHKEEFSLLQAIKSIDFAGSFLLVAGVTALMLGINLGGNVLSWNHPLVISSLIACGFITALFITVERNATRPVMPLPLLFSVPRANLILGNFFASFTSNTILFNAPLYFQAVKLESATDAGFHLVTASVILMISSVLTGFLITTTRRLQPPLLLGSVCFILGTLSMSGLQKDTPSWKASLSIAPSNLAQGLAFPAILLSVLAATSSDEQAVATTTLGLFRNLGSVMGIAFSSWTLQTSLLMYLNQSVTGVNKAEIIGLVRKSVAAIAKLDPIHRNEVIYAYENALRVTFLSTIFSSTMVFILIVPLKLSPLRRRE